MGAASMVEASTEVVSMAVAFMGADSMAGAANPSSTSWTAHKLFARGSTRGKFLHALSSRLNYLSIDFNVSRQACIGTHLAKQ